MDRVAFVVTPHGFGHAARASAVADALQRLRPGIGIDIVTTVPRWFFDDSLDGPFGYHPLRTDVGLVQTSSLIEDPSATAEALAEFVPFATRSGALADALGRLGCRLVVCDIAPLGIAAARRAGIPSVLVENFTWDWIYQAYLADEPRLGTIAEEMASVFADATLHIQAEPVCRPSARAVAVPPVYRRRRGRDQQVREALGIAGDRPLVLLTMGGSAFDHEVFEQLRRWPETVFVVHGASTAVESCGNLVALPRRSPVFMPDLIGAADAVVGKLGYSTVAEAWGAGTRYAYVPRERFRESQVLERFVRDRLPVMEIPAETFGSPGWIADLGDLLATPRPAPASVNGADAIASHLVELLDR